MSYDSTEPHYFRLPARVSQALVRLGWCDYNTARSMTAGALYDLLEEKSMETETRGPKKA